MIRQQVTNPASLHQRKGSRRMKKEILSAIFGGLGASAIPLSTNSAMPSGKGKRDRQGVYWGRSGAKILRKFHSGIAGLRGKTRHERNAAGYKLPF
jgi:hypothetical protein